MKECDKQKSHISSKRHMIYISSDNVRHPGAINIIIVMQHLDFWNIIVRPNCSGRLYLEAALFLFLQFTIITYIV
jgi:hypothetical protein